MNIRTVRPTRPIHCTKRSQSIVVCCAQRAHTHTKLYKVRLISDSFVHSALTENPYMTLETHGRPHLASVTHARCTFVLFSDFCVFLLFVCSGAAVVVTQWINSPLNHPDIYPVHRSPSIHESYSHTHTPATPFDDTYRTENRLLRIITFRHTDTGAVRLTK